VMAELHGEKIDIVDWSDDPADLVGNALSPARVSGVEVVDAEARVARVIVPDYQLSLAIGKEGQNARLAARLTGWRIDIRSDTEQPGAAGAERSRGPAAGRSGQAGQPSGRGASGPGSPGESGSSASASSEAGRTSAPPAPAPSESGEHATGPADASAR
jgi:transcription termination/antitermination protein NusA